MLSHLKKRKSIESILNRIKNKKHLESEDDSDFESEGERRKRLLCEEVGNTAYVNNLKHVCNLFKKYKTELEDFTYISIEDFKKLKLGGTLRYVNTNGEIRFGGLLVGVQGDDVYETIRFIIRKQSGKLMQISF